MKTLETDIEVKEDGSMRVLSPLPSWLPHGRSHVLLVMADGSEDGPWYGIESSKNVCGGDACITRTRIPVWTLEQSRRLGFTEQELLDAYPNLQRSDLLAAWAYVARHRSEIDQAICKNEEA